MRISTREAVKMIARRAGKSLGQLSGEVTGSTPAAFVNMVARGSMKMGVGAKVAEQCGYALMFVPIELKDMIEEGIEIKAEV